MTDVRATSCTVIYQHPERDGGAPVTGYMLEHRSGPDGKWTRVNDTPVTDLQHTIGNLALTTRYEFRVAAMNMKGMSDFSQISPEIMTVVHIPDQPGRPEVDVIGTSVCLQWTAPFSDGGADITEYRVMCCMSDKTEYISVSADANAEPLISYTIRNQLKPYTEYRIAVTAVNRMGQGPWSDESEFVTFAGTFNIP